MLDRVLSFCVVIGPTIFALVLELVDERIRKHPFWKYGVVVFGIILSAATWWQMSRQTASAAVDQEQAIERVAKETSTSVSASVSKAIGQQYQDMITELNMQIQSLKQQLSEQAKDFDAQLKQTDTDLNGSISKVGTAPIKYAQIAFKAWSQQENGAVDSLPTIIPDSDGVYSVDFVFINTSDTATGSGDVWVYICQPCEFSGDQTGFDKPNGMGDKERHLVFAQLNPGVIMEKKTIRMKITGGPFAWTDVAFSYSCAMCGKIGVPHPVRYLIGAGTTSN